VSENRILHPAGARLDGVATGDSDAEASAHVASCAECSAYVARLREELDSFSRAQAEHPDGFVASVLQRRAAAGNGNSVMPDLYGRAGNAVGRRSPLRGRWIAGAASVLALAAVVLLVLRPPRSEPLDPAGVGPREGPIRFKGGAQVAVIVEHRGVQSRELGSLVIAPGDRIRVEIALDHQEPVTAGVLTEAGEWAELQPQALFEAGTHFSEKSIAFDGNVEEGWVVVGPPEAVERARQTRDFRVVHAIRIHAAPP
jgi:hypothetical protein